MNQTFQNVIADQLAQIRSEKLYKTERALNSSQGRLVTLGDRQVLNFCSNNYLGLSNDPDLISAVKKGLDQYGFGLSSVRFICGTQTQHRELEHELAQLVKTEDAILYSSCFDANAGLFETILTDQDAIISDQLNHASIIDGIRLTKAERHRFAHSDMADLEQKLKSTRNKRLRMIATDGVFSMDGELAKLPQICDLAQRYDAIVMVDDSHATGLIGQHGRGSLEVTGTLGKVDIITSTLGKALGGGSGGFSAGSAQLVDLLRQRSRTYLFSNSLAPPIVAGALWLVRHQSQLKNKRANLAKRTRQFRKAMTERGFNIPPGDHPIVAVMLGEAQLAKDMAQSLLTKGIFVVGFWYPVVPKGTARIRVQLSAQHTESDVEQAIEAFTSVGQKLKVI